MSFLSPLIATIGTVIWPFAKEWLLGMKDHPNSDGRSNQILPSRIIIIVLLIACGNLLFYATNLRTEIVTLNRKYIEEKLLLAANNPGGMSEDDFRIKAELKYDLIACTSRADSQSEAIKTVRTENIQLREVNAKLVNAMSKPPINKPPNVEDSAVESVKDRLKRLKL